MDDEARRSVASSSPSWSDYHACQLSSWYPLLVEAAAAAARHRSSPNHSLDDHDNDIAFPQTFESRILDLTAAQSQAVVDYLQQDGIHLPPNTQPSSCLACRPERVVDEDDEDDDHSDSTTNDSVPDDTHNNSGPQPPQPEPEQQQWPVALQEVTVKLQQAIRSLGGSVLVKLNWSAPKDAAWINEGTLECQTAGDVYLMLKSSEFCASDVDLLQSQSSLPPQQHAPEPEQEETAPIHPSTNNNTNLSLPIVLRKFHRPWHASLEFRCFVQDHQIVALCQRSTDQCFAHLIQDQAPVVDVLPQPQPLLSSKQYCQSSGWWWVPELIATVYQTHVAPMTRAQHMTKYVLDVYLEPRRPRPLYPFSFPNDNDDDDDLFEKYQLYIVDFNVWGPRTDALLFDWDHLSRLAAARTAVATTTTEPSAEPAPVVRLVAPSAQPHQQQQQQPAVRPSSLHNFRAPVDTIPLASLTGGHAHSFQALMELYQTQTQEEEEEEEEGGGGDATNPD